MAAVSKILIVEDDVSSLKLLELVLENEAYEVTSCSDGEEAWQYYREAPHALIISDWHMPKMDGLELCRKVRGHNTENRQYTYFILLTAESAVWDNYEKAMAAGVDDFMSKPLDPLILRARLHVAQRIISFNREMRHLQKLMTICCYSKRVLNEKDEWEPVEAYFERTLGIHFSHGISPEAYEDIVRPELERQKESLRISDDPDCCDKRD